MRPIRLVAIVHKYPPIHNAGAEWMLHAILRDFVSRGHEATVVFSGGPNPYRLDGVLVASSDRLDWHRLALEHDVVVTHLDQTERAIRAAQGAGRPLVHLVHNDRQLQFHRVRPGPDVLVVPNSEWIAATIDRRYRSVIVRPRVELDRYEAPLGLERDRVTLINLTYQKGATRLYELAGAMPERRFLAVAGAYGIQTVDTARRHPNIEVLENTPDIVGEVYSRTRVLLMPSEYESWGRVAIEAAASGIPTIANATPGLLEALGSAGIFPDNAAGDWARELRALDDPDRYAEASARARARAVELEAITLADHDALELAIAELLDAGAYAPAKPMELTNALRARVKCPLCGAAGCVCAPDAVTVYDSLNVRIFSPAPDRRGPVKTYRTFRGDFRLSESHAIELGYAADPEEAELVGAARDRLAQAVPEELDRIEVLYRTASYPSRNAFLAAVAVRRDNVLAKVIDELVDELVTGASPTASSSSSAEALDAGAEAALRGRVGDVLAWVGDDPERAQRALESEVSGKKRSTLITELERLAEQ